MKNMRNKKMWNKVLSGMLTATMIVSVSGAVAGASETDAAAEPAAIQTEAVQPEIVQTEAVQTETAQPETAQTETVPADTVQEIADEAAPEAEQETAAPATGEQKVPETASAEEAAPATAAENAAEQKAEEQSSQDQSAADSTVAIETKEIWEATVPQAPALNHFKADVRAADYRADIVAVAESQVGYTEAVSADAQVKASRYGAWYGDPYATPWDSEFACFVLYYAGVPDIPYNADTAVWTQELQNRGMYFGPSYAAEAGDLVFFMEPDGYFHTGILVAVNDNEITVIGDINGVVCKETYSKDDTRIFAYGAVVKETPADLADKAAEEAAAQEEQAAEESDEIVKAEAQLQASMYADATETAALSDVAITVSGMLPENAQAKAWPVVTEVNGEETFAAYQLVIVDENGNEYHSEDADGDAITVTIYDENLTAMLQESEESRCWHKKNAEASETNDLMYAILEDGGVQFVTEAF